MRALVVLALASEAISIPRGTLTSPPITAEATLARPRAQPPSLGLLVSSSRFVGQASPTRIGVPLRWNASQVPALHMALVTPLRGGTWDWETGLGLASAERGLPAQDSFPIGATQSLYVVSLRLGLGASLPWPRFPLRLGINALPLLTQTDRSALGAAQTEMGLGGEITLGTDVALGRIFQTIPTALNLQGLWRLTVAGPVHWSGPGAALGMKVVLE